MNNIDDKIGKGNNDQQPQATTNSVVANDSIIAIKSAEDSRVHHKNNNDEKKKGNALLTDEESINVRLLGKPLVSRGHYTFYSAFAYRKHGDLMKQKKGRRWKGDKNVTDTKSCNLSSSCCSNGDNGLCSCDFGSSSSSSSNCSEWSVVHMNHFYAVRPWYSKQNSSDQRKSWQPHQKPSRKLTSTAVEQQSVCIAELELLWRDDQISMPNIIPLSTSSCKKRGRNKVVPSLLTTSNCESYGRNMMTSSNINHGIASSDDDDGGNCANNNGSNSNKLLLLPRRRTLPRRKRQPSAKKLEAAESFAAAVKSDHPLQNFSDRHSQLSATMSLNSTSGSVPLSSPSAQYKHGNVLCSVRLYVMPDQTAAGRLGGVHGEDEVLEINTWNTNDTEDGWPNNTFMNEIGSSGYSGGVDDYDYDNGNRSSRKLPSGCSGLVLRVEDFVEWVRGGLMDNENDDSESSHESSESECVDNSLNYQKITKTELPEKKNEYEPNSLPFTTDVKIEVKQLQKLGSNDKNKIKLESTLTVDVLKKKSLITDTLKTENESPLTIAVNKVKTEQKDVDHGKDKTEKHYNNYNNCYSKSVVEEAVEVEHVPLASACIHKVHCGCVGHRSQHCRFNLVNDRDTGTTRHNHHRYGLKNSCIKQQLVVMSYSRYCRYRAHLQRRRNERSNDGDIMNSTRVLFCRDTYDYPAELLLDPFNAQNLTQKNTAVLVNHMAPKLKGWPAYPASWKSFRWNRVRRRLRHLERGSNSNNDRRRRRLRQKLKKKCQRQNLASAAIADMSYSSSSSDDNSDSDGTSSTTNDDVTNTITTTTTSDSDGVSPSVITKTTNKNLSVAIMKVNGGVNFNNKNTVSADTNNKRLSLIQPAQEQPAKRRCVYSSKGPQQNQEVTYQHSQQFNKHVQQQKIHSFDRQLSTSLSTVQQPTTKIIHHYLPPSVSIKPVIVSDTNTSIQQQRFYENPLQNKQKQHTTVVSSQCQNNNQQQTSFPPVIIEYGEDNNDNKQKYGYQRRVEYHDFEDNLKQQQEQEKPRRWLVDALRLGGLEVTAVPLNVSGNNGNCNDGKNVGSTVTETLQNQNQLRRRHCGVSFESLSSTKNEQRYGNNDSNLDTDSDSVLMTVTPDVVCILNKSSQQQQIQRSHYQQTLSGGVSISTESEILQQYRPVNLKNKNSNPALHEKINQAINSLKQQQLNTPASNRNNNAIVMDKTNYQYNNSNSRRPKNDGIWQEACPPALLDLTVKSSSNTTRRQKRSTVNKKVQANQKIISPFHSTATMRSAATNLEITIVPVSTSTTGNPINHAVNNVNGMQRPQKLSSNNNLIGGSEPPSTICSSSSVERQNAVSPFIVNMLCSDKNQQNRQLSCSGSTTNSSKKQILIMGTSSTLGTTDSQQNSKHKSQQNKKKN